MLGMKPGCRMIRMKALVPRQASRNGDVRDIKLTTGVKTKHTVYLALGSRTHTTNVISFIGDWGDKQAV